MIGMTPALSMTELIELIAQWFKDRGLDKADPKAQMLKLSEEVGELAGAIARDDSPEIADAMGDITVVLIGLCEIMGYDYRTCVNMAYDVIKDRKGMLVNGVWLKESDYIKRLIYNNGTTVKMVDDHTEGNMHMDNGVIEVVNIHGESIEIYPLDEIVFNTITKDVQVIRKQED